MSKKNKIGGNVIASGGFGCVFSPALKCTKSKKTPKKSITKLMITKFAMDEYNEINTIKKQLKHIKKYNNYFVLNNISLCRPRPLSKKDLIGFNQKCTALPKDDINVNNINDNMDRLMALTMKNAGLPIDDYILEKKDFRTIYTINVKLIDLFKNGIIPMNSSNVYHNDIKDSNILMDENKNKLFARLIDWGLAVKYVPFTGQKFPSCWRNRPLQYNSPYSTIIFSQTFVDKFKEFGVNGSNNLTGFVNDYLDYWIKERGEGHYKLMCKLINILTDDHPKVVMVNYIVSILKVFFNESNNTEEDIIFNLRKYLDNVFVQNVDKWGFVTSYFPILHLYHTNKYSLSKTQQDTFLTLRELFYYTYTTASIKLDVNTILNYLNLLKVNIVGNDEQTRGTPSTIIFSSTPKGITGHTIEINNYHLKKKLNTKSHKKSHKKTRKFKNHIMLL